MLSKAEIHFIYESIKVLDQEWFNHYWDTYLRGKVTVYSPSTGKWLKHCKVRVTEDDTLEIHIPDKAIYDNILLKKCDKFIEHHLQISFGLTFEVKLFLHDEHLDRHDEHRQERDAEVVDFVKNNCVNTGGSGGGSSTPQKSNFGDGKKKGEGYKRTKAKSDDPSVVYKRLVKQPIIKINEIVEEESVVCIEGKIFFLETRELRGGKTLVSMALTDYSGSMTSKIFLDPKMLKLLIALKRKKI